VALLGCVRSPSTTDVPWCRVRFVAWVRMGCIPRCIAALGLLSAVVVVGGGSRAHAAPPAPAPWTVGYYASTSNSSTSCVLWVSDGASGDPVWTVNTNVSVRVGCERLSGYANPATFSGPVTIQRCTLGGVPSEWSGERCVSPFVTVATLYSTGAGSNLCTTSGSWPAWSTEGTWPGATADSFYMASAQTARLCGTISAPTLFGQSNDALYRLTANVTIGVLSDNNGLGPSGMPGARASVALCTPTTCLGPTAAVSSFASTGASPRWSWGREESEDDAECVVSGIGLSPRSWVPGLVGRLRCTLVALFVPSDGAWDSLWATGESIIGDKAPFAYFSGAISTVNGLPDSLDAGRAARRDRCPTFGVDLTEYGVPEPTRDQQGESVCPAFMPSDGGFLGTVAQIRPAGGGDDGFTVDIRALFGILVYVFFAYSLISSTVKLLSK